MNVRWCLMLVWLRWHNVTHAGILHVHIGVGGRNKSCSSQALPKLSRQLKLFQIGGSCDVMLGRRWLMCRHLAMVLLGCVDLVGVMLIMRLLVLLMVMMLMRLIASACMIEWACIKGLGTRGWVRHISGFFRFTLTAWAHGCQGKRPMRIVNEDPGQSQARDRQKCWHSVL